MTDFQLKRLEYFIKQAETYGWVRLAPSDKELFAHTEITSFNDYAEGYEDGYNDRINLTEATKEDLKAIGLE